MFLINHAAIPLFSLAEDSNQAFEAIHYQLFLWSSNLNKSCKFKVLIFHYLFHVCLSIENIVRKRLMGKEEVKDNEKVKDGAFTEKNKSNRRQEEWDGVQGNTESRVIQL